MPWKASTVVIERQEFLALALREGSNISSLCRRFGISRKTGYKWLSRAREGVPAPPVNRSRRPHSSPNRTSAAQERAVLAVRERHPAWGGRKIRRVLRRRGANRDRVPAASTITMILRRHGQIDPAESQKHQSFQRFEHPAPNDLWQMDFKGHFGMTNGRRCHPLTVLDDHSRFSIALQACDDQKGTTVQIRLRCAFRRYGLPKRMLMDNGSPWGSDAEHVFTPLTVWLIRLGIRVSHGRPFHPQTQGKNERFNRTFEVEVLRGNRFGNTKHAQRTFDPWRNVYNLERPHEALQMQVPADRYAPSSRPFPENLPPIEYGPGDIVRKVQCGGELHYRGRIYKVCKAFRGQPVALRPHRDGHLDVYYYRQWIGRIDERVEASHERSIAGGPSSVRLVRCAHSAHSSRAPRNPLRQGTP